MGTVGGELERSQQWRVLACLLLFPRTRVWFPAPRSGASPLPITLPPGWLVSTDNLTRVWPSDVCDPRTCVGIHAVILALQRWKQEGSEVQDHPWKLRGLETGLSYMRPCLWEKPERERITFLKIVVGGLPVGSHLAWPLLFSLKGYIWGTDIQVKSGSPIVSTLVSPLSLYKT